MEIIIKEDLEKLLPSAIQFNYEELKSELKESIEKYQGLLITEDAIIPAKADHAKLNNLIKALETARKSVKAACLKPLEDFDAKVKELIGMVDAPREEIKKQLNEFEERRIAERKTDIEQIFAGSIGDLDGLVKLETIYSKQWENKGATLAKIEEELKSALATMREGQEAIDKLCESLDAGKHRNDALGILFAGQGVSAAITKINQALARDKQLAELDAKRKAESEEKRIAVEAKKPTPPPVFVEATPAMVEANTTQAQIPETAQNAPQAEKTITFTLRLTGELSAMKALREFINNNGISYEKL